MNKVITETYSVDIDKDLHDLSITKLREASTMLLCLNLEGAITTETYEYINDQVIGALHYLFELEDE